MKRILSFIPDARRRMATVVLLFASALAGMANTVETVSQVSGTVTISGAVDYVVISPVPFAAGAVVDIANTEHAVVILQQVQPSQAVNLLSYIRINGEKAVNNTNCMVKIYANGSIILPHGTAVKPLTVYTGTDQTGESAQYGVSGRVSLYSSPLNNKIKSFTLMRGYMVCFATQYNGKGYSRVFIADKENRQVNLPAILSNSISSIRVMQWNDASKKGYAGRDAVVNTALKTTWCYNWDAGNDAYADREFVTQRHHESGIKNGKYEGAWPSVDDCGNNGTSPHILGQNEPDNVSDPREVVTTIEQLLAVWPDLMATGKRLGSPAMAGNLNMLYQFIDSIDKRGWRCDYVVLHCYWYSDWSSWRSTLQNVRSRTNRPIWITEMNYGANWTGWPGADRTGSAANFAIEKQHFAPIVDGLESTGYVERYAVYNHVEDCRSMYLNGALTPMGEYYAGTQSNIAYNSIYESVPKLPATKGAPDGLTVKFDKATGMARLTWREYNGEYNERMAIERMTAGGTWQELAEIDLAETEAAYSYEDLEAQDGYQYRVRIVYADGKSYYSKTAVAVPDEIGAGDAVTIDGITYYVGGNLFVNGDFDLGMSHWTNGENAPIAQPYFSVMPVGGYDGGSYLQAWSNMSIDKAGAVKTLVDLVPGSNYYFSMASRFDGVPYHRIGLTTDGTTEDSLALSMKSSATWAKQAGSFNSGSYSKGFLSLRWLGSKAQFGQVLLARLFSSRDEAIADGIASARRRAAAVQAYNTEMPLLNSELAAVAAAVSGNSDAALAAIETAVSTALQALRCKPAVDSLMAVAATVAPLQMPGYERLQAALDATAEAGATAAGYVEAAAELRSACNAYLPFTATAGNIASPAFNGTSLGWTVGCGTYTGGTQQQTARAGKTCWSALWTGIDSSEGRGMTMEIKQQVNGFTHGFYVLECKAATEHYCLSDQHAYMVVGSDTLVSPNLTADYLDLPTVGDSVVWQTLTTKPVYLSESDTVMIGFVGSKQGAVDNAWREYGNASSTGDRREGWWSATDFVLRHLPLYRCTVSADGWGTLCLPYAATPSAGVKFYQIEGFNADKTMLCLTEIEQTQAGVPCIIRSEQPEVTIFESGAPVSRTTLGACNLRGMLITSARAPAGSFVLQNGEWNKVESTDRPRLSNFTAFINKTDDIPVLEAWSGVMMKINGASGSGDTGVGSVISGGSTAAATYYTIGGRKAAGTGSGGSGVYIRKSGGETHKVRIRR
jgi:Holliday junction resolvasome RuvABC endonuclease subunit